MNCVAILLGEFEDLIAKFNAADPHDHDRIRGYAQGLSKALGCMEMTGIQWATLKRYREKVGIALDIDFRP